MKITSRILVAVGILLSISCISCRHSGAKEPVKAAVNENTPSVGINIGDKAPELSLPGTDGKNITLSSLHGKMVLVDFWASWCPPCRQENPNLVSVYQEFKDRSFKRGEGFTVYSVSLDRTKEAWLRGIKEDRLEWPSHVSDLKYWYSDAARTYQVEGIPTNWLIDGNGIIVAKNLRGDMLRQTLVSLVK